MSSEQQSVVGEQLVSESGHVVAIVGSRTFPFERWPMRSVDTVGEALLEAGWSVSKVVSGGAEGVDSAAGAWAGFVGCPLHEIEPDWDEHGRRAGFVRNSTIVREADTVVGLWNGTSSGTRDTLGKARVALGDENVFVYPIGNAEPGLDVTSVPREEL